MSGGGHGTSSAASRGATPPPPDGGWGWVVVFASFMIHIFADGMTYSFGVFHNELVKYFEESEAATSLIASILVGMTLCTGPLSSALVNRYGCRAVTVAGALLSGFGITLSAFAQGVTSLYLTIGIITGSGLGLIYLPAIVSVTCYFERLRSLATGIAVCGSGLGTFLLAPLTEWLVGELGWRGAMAVTGALMLHCIIFGLLFRPIEPPPVTPPPTPVLRLKPLNGTMVPRENGPTFGGGDEESQTNNNKRPHSVHGLLLGHSQPHLNSQDSRQFGSLGLMYRKDVFYSGSLAHLAQDKKSGSLTETKLPEKRPLMGGGGGGVEAATVLPDSHLKNKKKPQDVEIHEETEGKKVCGLPVGSFSILAEMLDVSLFRDPIFLIFALSNFCTSLGFNVPYVYILSQAEEKGIGKREGSFLLATIGIANTFGRIVLGYLSDKEWVNRLWVYNTCLALCGLCTALSFLCTDMVGFAIYASIFGFTVGAYVGLTSVILVDLLGLDKLTNAFGLLLLFQGIASLIGPPITGWLYDASKSYTSGFAVAGGMICLSGLMLFAVPSLQACLERRRARASVSSIS